ncbi:MAG TPA: tRNA dihydrouridine(20/20a) synthase DusA [Gammaproteobacteria bacterium]|nr:tRNA dihydrouridine(20/20a) synthase DusA [Gammaproteobacteria bacterium]
MQNQQTSQVSKMQFPIISVAPMMDYTDRHFRFLLRLISKNTLLYTEMITTGALLHGDYQGLLAYHPAEHPLTLQLGGSHPDELAQCARMAEDFGYDEVNLNIGCPSSRVQEGRFGVCLLKEPQLVAECVAAMQQAVSIPITVKTRIGVDEIDSYEHLCHFIQQVSQAGCSRFIIHARKAWLKGLSPKDNRTIPPLRYDVVYQLKRDFPKLKIILNGGIQTLQQITSALEHVDGVMLGRSICQHPYLLAEIDDLLKLSSTPSLSRVEVVEYFLEYIQKQLMQKIRLNSLSRHLLNIFHGVRGANAWRRYLSEHAHKTEAGIEVVQSALKFIL